ncbi:Chromatin modification-related protein [Actinidia chinensis var. chinensis]|uniref:Chromatin modification-related protein n=1 Tax=Actinidia chinensis var. chinensis TaxID=1590841 RepID=A0A2R6PKK4_ACTCC|nr:chromatin modification-related protein eaf6-like isoform X2 [Actinidia eriantha]PSR92871.1 Chromatin modification-related protein [Actinidia chinensis var. chinensis]
MQSEGKKVSCNLEATLASLVSKRQKLQQELHNIEKQVYELETSYLQESTNFGNAFKGFDGFLSASRNTANLKRSRRFLPDDRIFSLSSVTSPASEEQGVGRDDGRSDIGQGRPKGGGLTANPPGKPKKGRTGPRDGKKTRMSSDFDPDDEDDPDSSWR